MANVTVDPKALIEGERPSLLNASYGKLMMWFFLMSDAFTFSALLIAYGALRVRSTSQGVPWANPEDVFTHTPVLYEFFHIEAPLVFVGIMTFILILSSVTMVLAVEAGHRKSQKEVAKWMLWTIVGGLTFVLCQAYEWYHFIVGHDTGAYKVLIEGKEMIALLVAEPGVMAIKNFSGEILATGSTAFGNVINAMHLHDMAVGERVPEIIRIALENNSPEVAAVLQSGLDAYGAEGMLTYGGANMLVNEYGPPAFANLFFFVTGFHGTHVFSGVVLNFVIYLNVIKGTYERRGHYEMVEKVGLYWHFVDLVWVFVFTFFYLV
jgi:cytochrome c oxidase subunit 3